MRADGRQRVQLAVVGADAEQPARRAAEDEASGHRHGEMGTTCQLDLTAGAVGAQGALQVEQATVDTLPGGGMADLGMSAAKKRGRID